MNDMGARRNPQAAIVPRLLPRYAHDTQAAQQIPALTGASRWRDMAEPAPSDEVVREHLWQAPPWIDGAAGGHADPAIFPQAGSLDEHDDAESPPVQSSETPPLSGLSVEPSETMVSGGHDVAGAAATAPVPAQPEIEAAAGTGAIAATPQPLPADASQAPTVVEPLMAPAIVPTSMSAQPIQLKAASVPENAAAAPAHSVAPTLSVPDQGGPVFRSPPASTLLSQQHDGSRQLAVIPDAGATEAGRAPVAGKPSVDSVAVGASGAPRTVSEPAASVEAQQIAPGTTPAPEARAPQHAGRIAPDTATVVLPIAEPGNPTESQSSRPAPPRAESDATQPPPPEIRPADVHIAAAGIEHVVRTPNGKVELGAANMDDPAPRPLAQAARAHEEQPVQDRSPNPPQPASIVPAANLPFPAGAVQTPPLEPQPGVLPGAMPAAGAPGKPHPSAQEAMAVAARRGQPAAASQVETSAPPQPATVDTGQASSFAARSAIEPGVGTPNGHRSAADTLTTGAPGSASTACTVPHAAMPDASPGTNPGPANDPSRAAHMDGPSPRPVAQAARAHEQQPVQDRPASPPPPASIVPAANLPFPAGAVQTPPLEPQQGVLPGAMPAAGAPGKPHTSAQEAMAFAVSSGRPAPSQPTTVNTGQASWFAAHSAIEPSAGTPNGHRSDAGTLTTDAPGSASAVRTTPHAAMPDASPGTNPGPENESSPAPGTAPGKVELAAAHLDDAAPRPVAQAAREHEKQPVQDRPATPPPPASIVPAANPSFPVGAVQTPPLEPQPGVLPGAMSAAGAPGKPHPSAQQRAPFAARRRQPAPASQVETSAPPRPATVHTGHVPSLAASSATEPRVAPRRLLDQDPAPGSSNAAPIAALASAPVPSPAPLQSAARQDAPPAIAAAAHRALPAATVAQAASLTQAPQASPKAPRPSSPQAAPVSSPAVATAPQSRSAGAQPRAIVTTTPGRQAIWTAAPAAETNRRALISHRIALEAAIAAPVAPSPTNYRRANPSGTHPTAGGAHAAMPVQRRRVTPAPAAAPTHGVPANRPGNPSAPALRAPGPAAAPPPGQVRVSDHSPAGSVTSVQGNPQAPAIPGHGPNNASAITPQRAPQAPARGTGADAGQDAPVTVRVNIGRIRIEGAPAAAPPARAFRRPAPTLSLAQYTQRRGGRRP